MLAAAPAHQLLAIVHATRMKRLPALATGASMSTAASTSLSLSKNERLCSMLPCMRCRRVALPGQDARSQVRFR